MADLDRDRSAPSDGDDLDVEAEEIQDRKHWLEQQPETPDIQSYLQDLPKEVKRRVRALKKVQLDVTRIEGKFYEEMHALECKYLSLYQPLFDKRKQITCGEYEPTEEECDFGSDTECGDVDKELTKKLDGALNLKAQEDADDEQPKGKAVGIPEFWLKIFHHVDMLNEMIESYDEPILEHLTDIKVEATTEPMGFKLNFHFSPNEFFTNTVLTKSYEMKCEMDPEDPFSFEGPEIVKCSGCTIDWVKGKNVTVKTIRKKQKHKQRGSIRTVSKTVNAPSFFNFFTPPTIPEERNSEVDEETQMRLTSDFEVGQYIRERIVPRAVLFFTGEALDDDFEEEEEEDEEEEEEDDDDETEVPEAPGARKGASLKRVK